MKKTYGRNVLKTELIIYSFIIFPPFSLFFVLFYWWCFVYVPGLLFGLYFDIVYLCYSACMNNDCMTCILSFIINPCYADKYLKY
jgi:hypothetical protein